MVVSLQPFFVICGRIFLLKRYKMTLKIVFNSNILNNKRVCSSFTIQISIEMTDSRFDLAYIELR